MSTPEANLIRTAENLIVVAFTWKASPRARKTHRGIRFASDLKSGREATEELLELDSAILVDYRPATAEEWDLAQRGEAI